MQPIACVGLPLLLVLIAPTSTFAFVCTDFCAEGGAAVCHNGVRFGNWCHAHCAGVRASKDGSVPDGRCTATAKDEGGVGIDREAQLPIGKRTCAELVAAGLDFRAHEGAAVCAAARLPAEAGGTAVCARNAVDYAEAEARCAAVGASLCSYAQLSSGDVNGVGCGVDQADSMCWIENGGGGACGEGLAAVTRCKGGASSARVLCAPSTNAASLKCCAPHDGSTLANPRDPLGCGVHGCGTDCAAAEGCGWSTNAMKCVTGGKTSAAEMAMGDCGTGLRVASREECAAHACGASCAAAEGCGWSTTRMRCLPGLKTSKAEMAMGECDDAVIGSQSCDVHTCGAACAAAPGCGWSSGRMRCIAGAKTSKAELIMGPGCTDRESTQQCGAYKCGHECALAEGCGWSSPRMACVAGAVTSKRELVMCTGDPAPSTAATAPATASTAAPATAPRCTDDGSWVDSEGDSCHQYEVLGYCLDGAFGPFWDSTSNFRDYAVRGVDASMACCACGGGGLTSTAAPTTTTTTTTTAVTTTTTTTTTTTAGCVDTVPGWVDVDGDGCSDYSAKEFCLADGSYGPRWTPGEPWDLYAPPGRPGANVVCCACGGGSTGAEVERDPVTTAPTTPAEYEVDGASFSSLLAPNGMICDINKNPRSPSQQWGSSNTLLKCMQKCAAQGADKCAYVVHSGAGSDTTTGYCRLLGSCAHLTVPGGTQRAVYRVE